MLYDQKVLQQLYFGEARFVSPVSGAFGKALVIRWSCKSAILFVTCPAPVDQDICKKFLAKNKKAPRKISLSA
jgi:hypothetical protein